MSAKETVVTPNVLSIEAKEKLSAVMGALYISEALFKNIEPNIQQDDSVIRILVDSLKESLDVALCLMGDNGDQSLEVVLGLGSENANWQEVFDKFRDEHRVIMANASKKLAHRDIAA